MRRAFIGLTILVCACAGGPPREEIIGALTDLDGAFVVAEADYIASSTILAPNMGESDKMKRRRVAMVEAARKLIATMKGKL